MSGEAQSVQRRITEFWSTIWPEYEGHEANVAAAGSDQYGAWVAAIQSALPPDPGDVLDVGTGTGFAAYICAALGHRVTGLDLAIGMLAVARARANRHESPQFVIGDAVGPPFADESFDVVMSRHLLWTLREPETAFRNWRRLLRSGGRVVAIDSLDAVPLEPDELSDDTKGAITLFERYYTRETRTVLPVMAMESIGPLVAMFESAGFSGVRATQLRGLPYPASGPDDEKNPYVLVAFNP